MTTEPLIDRLDRLTAILELALAPQLAAASERLRADPLDAAIFDLTAGDWIGGGDLQRRLTAETGAKQRTVREHLSHLVASGTLEKRGEGRASEYRSWGII